jgi:hypothetical protein
MKKEIPVPTTTRKFFRQYISLLNPILKLRDKEAAVLGELLYHSWLHKDIPEPSRWKLVFDYDTKLGIKEELGMSSASLDNIFTALRKKKIIDPLENKLSKGLVVDPKFPFELSFKFTV